MDHQPDGAAFDIVLLLHVACVVVGLVTTVTAAATAARLRRLLAASAPLPEPVRRYFRPGVNWAGRTIWGIPVFGFALLALSQGAYALRDGWVTGGLAIFVAVALLAEGVLWPAERRIQAALGSEGAAGARCGGHRPRRRRDGAGGQRGPCALAGGHGADDRPALDRQGDVPAAPVGWVPVRVGRVPGRHGSGRVRRHQMLGRRRPLPGLGA